MSASSQPSLNSVETHHSTIEDVVSTPAANEPTAEKPVPEDQRRQIVGDSRTAILAKRQAILLRVLADFGSEPTLEAGLVAAANTIKYRLDCSRVSFGLCFSDRVEVVAISQQAEIDARTTETDLLAAAMLEVSERHDVVEVSALTTGDSRLQSHRLLAAGRPDRQIISLPICHENRCLAVLCIERDSPTSMSSLTLQLIRNISSVLAPQIECRLVSERGLFTHCGDSLRHLLNLSVTPRYLKIKATAVLITCLLAMACVIEIPHKVKAESELVPLERRVISAPRDGYIRTIEKSPGDAVLVDDVLLQLDTAELSVEESRWRSELSSTSTELRSAMADSDRRKMAMVGAERDKIDAQLSLLNEQLKRSVVRAPVSGVIVSGDLSQMVGAPVERGQTLMEIAPPEGYEVQLMVDESDIGAVSLGNTGQLSLKALPRDPIKFTVSEIHPIGVAQEGANRFLVKALLLNPSSELLPGQTGLGKIEVGSASVIWILTHEFADWLRLQRWEWFG